MSTNFVFQTLVLGQPGFVYDLTAGSATSTTLTLAFTNQSGARSYEFRQSTTSALTGFGAWTALAANKVVTGLSSSTQYWFQVRSVSGLARGGGSNTATGTTSAGGSTVAFVSSTAGSAKNGTGTSFTFTSFAVSGTHPVIIVCTGLASDTATISSVAVSAGLTSGTIVEVKNIRTTQITSPHAFLSAFAIPAPTGTGTITVNLSASVAWQSQALLFSGADQTTPCPTGDAVSTLCGTAAAPVTMTLTPTNLTANDGKVALVANASNGDAPHISAPGTETYFDNGTAVNLAAGYKLGTGSIVGTDGNATEDNAAAMVAIRIAAG